MDRHTYMIQTYRQTNTDWLTTKDLLDFNEFLSCAQWGDGQEGYSLLLLPHPTVSHLLLTSDSVNFLPKLFSPIFFSSISNPTVSHLPPPYPDSQLPFQLSASFPNARLEVWWFQKYKIMYQPGSAQYSSEFLCDFCAIFQYNIYCNYDSHVCYHLEMLIVDAIGEQKFKIDEYLNTDKTYSHIL